MIVWRMLHEGLASMPLKVLLLVGNIIGASAGSLITEVAGTSGFAGGVYGAVLTTALLVTPRLMEQFRKKKETDHQINEDSADRTLRRISEFYELQIRDLTARLAYREMVGAERDVIATLERRAKHDVLDQLTAAEGAIREMTIQIRTCQNCSGADLIAYHPKGYTALCGKYDEQVQEAKKRIADSAATA